jgi:hypothetical protein
MPTVLQFRRGTTSQNNSFTGSAGEISVDTSTNQLRIHDGSTAGGATVGIDTKNIQIGVSGDNELDTSSGNLTIDSAGGTVTVDDNLTVSGTITGGLTGDVTGNADTATALETARTIAGQSFDGSANITIAATDLSDTDQSLSTTDNVTFNNMTVSGNLTVSGTTTTVNTETINLADNTITLNSNATGSATENGGIEIERGDDTNKTLVWNETDDKWTVGSETFVAGTFEGALTGNVTGDVTGNADTATTLETARTIAGQSFDGSANITIASTDLSNTSAITLNTATQTLTNKTISGSSNTLSNIGNSSLSNSSITINGTAIALGSSGDISAGTSWQAVKTSAFTAVAGEGYFVNTTSGAITVTLPSSPSQGDEVSIIDYAGTADSNNITVSRNGQNIQGSASNLTVSVERAGFTLVYTDSTQGWLLKDK